MTPPVTPPSTGESLPHCPLAGAKPRDGASGAAHVPGGCGCRPRLGVRQPAQDRDPLAYGVRTGREPLVRQGLPAGEHGDRVRRHQGAQRVGQVFGLPRGSGDREHEPAGAAGGTGRQRGRDQRAQCLRGDDVALASVRRAGLVIERGTELGIFGYGGE